jgi:HK97 family phage portal protein
MIDRIARGFGMAGFSESVRDAGQQSRTGWTTIGALPMVASQGVNRWATYRLVYLTNPWVYASVNMLSRGIGRLPLHTYQLDAKGRKQRIRSDISTPGRPTSGQVLDRLLQRPAAGMSRNAMYGGTMIDRLVYGNALWIIDRDSYGVPSQLRRVRWRDMLRVVPDEDGAPVSYQYRPWNGLMYGPDRLVAAGDVIHFGLGSDPEGIYGISPLETCRYTLALHDALVRHLISYFANMARPSGVFKVDKLTKERIDEIRNMLTELYTSPENAGKILATTGEWQQISHDPSHSSVVELIKLSREEIAATYAVPPPVLGILDQAIKSNVKELREQYARDSLGPHASDFEGELMAQLLTTQPSWSSLFVEFELAELLRPDLEARALVYQRLQSVFSIDDIRGWENLPPYDIPGVSDVPWIPRGAQPLGTIAPNNADKPQQDDTTDEPELGTADAPEQGA